jgi:SAM-dependent methyltransferase
MTAAERFYSRSNEINERAQVRSSDEVLEELAQPSHRYFCVQQHLRTHPNLSVIELGFGSPGVAAALSLFCRSYRIVDVVDRRDDTVLPENVPFTRADLNDDFPFSNGEFDCTVAMMVIEHLFDPFHSFSEVARITRQGGKVLVNLPNIASIRCRLELLQGKMPVTSSNNWYEKCEWDGNHLHYFTVSDTIRLAKKFGLTLDAVYPVGNQLWLKRLNPRLFCHEISYSFSK